jgi:hypothetical protein
MKKKWLKVNKSKQNRLNCVPVGCFENWNCIVIFLTSFLFELCKKMYIFIDFNENSHDAKERIIRSKHESVSFEEFGFYFNNVPMLIDSSNEFLSTTHTFMVLHF